MKRGLLTEVTLCIRFDVPQKVRLLGAHHSLVIALLCLSQQEKDKAKIKMPILPDPQDGWCP